jgi:integrase
MTLTDVAIRTLKPAIKLQKISDGEGLQLWVMPVGSRLWRYAYRYNGSQKSLALGTYPQVTLAEARKKRDQARILLKSNIDPGQQRKLDKVSKAITDASTFEAVAEEYLAKKVLEGIAASTVKRLRSQLRYVYPAFGNRPISGITTPEVLSPLKKIDAKGIHETATRTKELCGAIFRYGMATGRRLDDPTQALRGALTSHKVQHRATILDPADFGTLLQSIEDFDGQPATKAALKLLPLVFTRPGELRNAEWREFDLDKAKWIIPAGRMKMRREHQVPLSRQAVVILKSLQLVSGEGKLLFPGNRSILQPISENTINAALRRMGYTKEQMTGHGFRSTASTLLNESKKFSPDAIERALAHQDSDEIRRAYNRGAYWDERVTMAQWWADYLDVLKQGGKIIELSSQRALAKARAVSA